MIRIALVDDHALIREGLSNLLQLDKCHEISWTAENGEQALDKIINKKQSVDIIVSDICMPVMNGIELTKSLRSSENLTPVLMLTTFNEYQLFIDAIKSGVNGFILKDVSLEKLNRAIKLVSEGGFFAEPELVVPSDSCSVSKTSSTTFVKRSDLKEKEIQILRYLAAGLSNKEIANASHLAEGTIKNSISDILSKLGCRDRTQAVLKALHNNLI